MDSLSVHCGEKRLTEPRVALQGLSWIKPEMVQQVLSSIGLPKERNSVETPSRGDSMNLFPHNRTASNDTVLPQIADSRSVSASITDKQSPPRLTIIYNGVVNVYHVSPEKAEAIMQLASSANKSTTTTVSNGSNGSKEEVAKPCAASSQQIKKANQGLPIARKLSLQRFLEKRKDRVSSASPYTSASDQSTTSLNASKETMVKDEGLEDPFTLSLSFPSQRAC